MRRVLANVRPVDFEVPEGVIFARIDRKTGLLADPDTQEAVFPPFRDGTTPTEIAPTGRRGGLDLPLRLD